MREHGIRGDPKYRLYESETLCQGAVVVVARQRIRFPNGHEATQDVILLPDAVAIVPIIVENEQRFVVLIEQFRNSLQGHIHEIPAGIIDPGEEPETAARRELEEETGFRAGRIERLASLLMIPGTSSHRLHFFLAEDLEPGTQALEQAECVRVRKVPFEPLVQRITDEPPGSTVVVDAKTHLGLLHVAARFDRAVCPGSGPTDADPERQRDTKGRGP